MSAGAAVHAEMDGLERARQQGALSDLDLHFARLVCVLDGDAAPGLALAAALATHHTGDGNVCLHLDAPPAMAGLPAPPALAAWRDALRASRAVGRPGERRPLILDAADRLYLQRYWVAEQRVAAALLARAVPRPMAGTALLEAAFAHVFPVQDEAAGRQRLAVAVAATRGLCVITGGPGTGKTTTVARLLALVQWLAAHGGAPARIALAAPTGKAAARMTEALSASRACEPGDGQRSTPLAGSPASPVDGHDAARPGAPSTGSVAGEVPGAQTLHRLLGLRPGGARHHAGHPLPADLLVLDEASMIDLPLMARVLDALPPSARLVLLGDPDQLASVEAGAVLGDLCAGAGAIPDAQTLRDLRPLTGPLPPGPGAAADPGRDASARAGAGRGGALAHAGRDPVSALAGSVVALDHSFRFGAATGVGRLAAAVRAGDARAALAILDDPACPDTTWLADAHTALVPAVLDGLSAHLHAMRSLARGAPDTGAGAPPLAGMQVLRVLCAHRHGAAGAERLNELIESALRGAVEDAAPRSGQWYAGRTVMITRNDYGLRLFNGDTGMAWPDPRAGGGLRVFFPEPRDGVRALSPARLGACETAFASTVHKSQGAEFNRVVLVLPAEISPVCTRELVYTAVTRARGSVQIAASRAVFEAAVERGLQRRSGLRDALGADQTGGSGAEHQ